MTKNEAVKYFRLLHIKLDDTIDEIEYKLRQHKLSDLVSCAAGASKRCLIFKDANCVIKWTKPLESCDDASENECLREYDIYKDAEQKGLAMFFPYTELLGDIWDIENVILQDKIDYSVYNCPLRKTEKYAKIARTVPISMYEKVNKGFKTQRRRRDLDSIWARMIVSLYGKRITKQLCEFIRYHEINDLHNRNVGYKDDKPILLDFSGYFR